MHAARRLIALLTLVAWTAVPLQARAASPVLLRDPYLTDVSGSWAMVSLATDTQSPAPVVAWGPASGNCTTPPSSVTATYVTSFVDVAGTTGRQFKAQLLGLQANTAYCYRVSQAGVDLLGTAPVFTSAMAAGAGDPFTFAVVGDWGAGTADEAKVMAQIAAARPSFVVTSGDNVYNSGTQAEYGDLKGGNAFAPQYWPQFGRTTPAVAVEGNHGFSGSLPYFQNWPADSTVGACAQAGCRYQRDTYCCTGALGTTSKSYPSAWYAFDWGNTRIYVLEGAWSDSYGGYQGDFQAHFNGPVAGCSYCGAELTWLTGDLASHPSAHKFAFWHYPLYSDSGSQTSDSYLQGSQALEGVLASHGVNIVFNGHAHQYERNYPQIAGSPMLSYITGGGGDPLGGVSRHSSFDAYAQAVYHYLRVTVNGSYVTVTPTDENGATFDVQTFNFPTSTGTDDFSIATTPSTVSVSQGQSITATVTTSVVSGTAQAVTLSASGLPAGATASFSPTTVTAGGNSTMTISTSSSTPGGTSTVAVTGTGTSATHSTSLALTVTVADDFSVGVSPTSTSVTQGQNAAATVSTAVVSGQAQTVTLSASGLPAGAGASFSQASLTAGGSATLTIATSTSTPAGSYSVSVTGTGTSATHSASLTLVVTGSTSGPRFVQASGATLSTLSTSLSATFAVPTQPGDLLVLSASVYTGLTNQISRVTDSAGNTWTRIGAFSTSGHFSDGELWYAPNAAAVTSVTVTVGTATVLAIQVAEFSGIAAVNPLDGFAGTSNTGTAAASGSANPTRSSDLAVAFIAGHGSSQSIVVTSTAFSTLPQTTSSNAGSTPASVITGYEVLSSTTAQSFAGSFSSTMYWAAGIALFKSA